MRSSLASTLVADAEGIPDIVSLQLEEVDPDSCCCAARWLGAIKLPLSISECISDTGALTFKGLLHLTPTGLVCLKPHFAQLLVCFATL